jgi:phage replication-related protein YjqB (UPF0714/DUF867 family)
VLLAAAAAAAAAAYLAARIRPELFLGPHGTWVFRRVEDLLRQRSARLSLAAEKVPAE